MKVFGAKDEDVVDAPKPNVPQLEHGAMPVVSFKNHCGYENGTTLIL